MSTSSIRAAQEAQGAVFTAVGAAEVARRYSDPAAEYAAVRGAAGLAVRSDLAPIRMWGRDPARMLHGLITNDVMSPAAGEGIYGSMLTPKGRMIAELRAFRRTTEEPELLVLLPREALAGTTEHLRKFVPPMFARWADVTHDLGVLGVYGPRAGEVVQAVIGGSLPEGEARFTEQQIDGAPILTVFTTDVGREPGYEIVAPTAALPALWESLTAHGGPLGARPVGFAALETLRVEAGHPRYGAELTDETIPTEAYEAIGWMPRAISFTKGCYTGQEVIVRIAHRGHVNRQLRGLLLGDAPTPARGTPLFNPESGKKVGWTTSAVVSPRLEQTIALGFVRREVESGEVVRLDSVEGEAATVVELPFTR